MRTHLHPRLVCPMFLLMLVMIAPSRLLATDKTQAPKLPAGFIENAGQLKSRDGRPVPGAFYSANTPEGNYLFFHDKIVFAPVHPAGEKDVILEMNLLDASSEMKDASSEMKIVGREKSDAVFRFFESGSKDCITSSMFSRVEYKNVYPQIDLVFYFSSGKCKYDFVAAAGADISKIKLRFSGQNQIALNKEGQLNVAYKGGVWKHDIPYSFQQHGKVSSSYQLEGNTVSFKVDYDASKALTIDPILTHATYFGGSNNEIVGNIKTDASGNIFISSYTNSSSGFPLTNPGGGAHYQSTYAFGSNFDGYVAKFSAAGNLLWCTYYGTGNEYNAFAMDVSPVNGNVAICGYTSSTSFPVFDPGTGAYFVGSSSGPSAGYVVEFNNNGVRQWATLVGPNGYGGLNALAYDPLGNLFVCGTVNGTYPTVNPGGGAYTQSFSGLDISWIGKFNSSRALTWATFYSGSGSGGYPGALACDASGNVVMYGVTRDAGFPTFNAGGGAYFQSLFGGGSYDGYLVKFDNNGVRLWATFLGGNGDEAAGSCTFDGSGNLYVCGNTAAGNFPVFNSGTGYYLASKPGTSSATLSKFSSSNVMSHSTYFGGNNYSSFSGVKLKGNGVYLVGTTNGTSLPVLNAFQSSLGGGYDIFLTKLSTNMTQQWTTYYGGIADEGAYSITCDNATNANLYVGGFTYGTSPVVNGGSFYYSSTFNGGTYDGLIAKVQDLTPATALDFDGQNDYVDLGSSSVFNSYPLTAECWVKTFGTSGFVGFINKYISGSGNGWRLGTNNGYLEGYYSKDNSNYALLNNNFSANVFIADGNWHHVAFTVDASGAKLYMDGTLRASAPWTGTAQATTTTTNLLLGSYPPPGSYFTGAMDEVRIWNRALCQGEIQNNMSCEPGSGQTGLLAYYKLNQGNVNTNNSTVFTAIDASGNGRNGTLNNFALNGVSSNWATGTVTGNCSSYTQLSLTANSNSPLGLSGTLNLTSAASGTGAASAAYSWTGPGSFSFAVQNPVVAHDLAYTGTYRVTATVNGCTATASTNASVKHNFYVDLSATGANSGGSWTDAFTDFQSALNLATSGDSVFVAQGIYKPSVSILPSPTARTKTFTLNEGVVHCGGFPAGGGSFTSRDFSNFRTILSGDIGTLNDSTDNSFVVVNASNLTSATLMNGFTIERGNADSNSFSVMYGQSGGLNLGASGNIKLDGVTFRNNYSRSGGALAGRGTHNITVSNCIFTSNGGFGASINAGTIVFQNCSFTNHNSGAVSVNNAAAFNGCTFTGNRVTGYGAVLNDGSGGSSFTDCVFTNNAATIDGGVLYSFYGVNTFTRCTFDQNTAGQDGGCIRIPGFTGGVTLDRCVFRGNKATSGIGGALNISNRNATITNCVFWNNSAPGFVAGAVYNNGGIMTVTNCSFNRNTCASSIGGGLQNNTGTTTLSNCIFWGNTAGSNTSSTAQIGGTVTASNMVWQGSTSGGTIFNFDPQFVNANTGDLSITACSPAIDNGATNTLTEDIVGNPRPVDLLSGGNTYDIGAFEVQSTPPAPLIVSVTPASGSPGSSITISGSNFGYSGTVKIGTATLTIVSYSNTSIAATLPSPSGVCSGNLVVTTVCGASSNNFAFTVNAPNITSVTPANAAAGSNVTITGTGFQNTGSVTIGGTSMAIVSYSPTSVVATMPSGICASTTIELTNVCGSTSNSFPYSITQFTASISPSGPTTFCEGGSVTLTANLGASYAWSTTAITRAIIANQTGSYTVTVTNASGCSAIASRSVTVNSNPVVFASSNTPVNAGDPILLNAAGANTYAWTGPNSYAAVGASIVRAFATLNYAGTYNVTGTDLNGCIGTASTTVVVNAPATALHFDGSNDYITVPNSSSVNIAGPITMEAWVKIDQVNVANSIIIWKGNTAGGNATSPYGLGYTGSNTNNPGNPRQRKVFVNVANGSAFQFVYSNSAIPIGTYSHVAATIDGVNIRIYINGILDATIPQTVNPASSVFPLSIGGIGNTISTVNASLDEVRLWSRALCSSEIQNNMNCELSGSQASLAAYYKLNQGFENADNSAVITANDASGNGNNGTLTNFSLTGTASNWINPGAVNSAGCSAFTAAFVNVKGNGNNINYGATTVSTSNSTDFGGTLPNSPVVKTFTIQNTGNSLLTITGITLSGVDASNFAVSNAPAAIPANSSATFDVTFNSSIANIATYDATVNIASDACNVPVYSFAVEARIICSMPAFSVCPQDMLAYTRSTSCDDVVGYVSTATGSPLPTISHSFNSGPPSSGDGSGSTFTRGTTHVVLTATNVCGSANCSFDVEVDDDVNPVLANVPIDETASCATIPPVGTPTASDNCVTAIVHYLGGSSTQGNDPTASDYYNYTLTRTWDATDGSNNHSSVGSQVITVQDIVAPTFTRPMDITIYSNASCGYNAGVAITGDVTNEHDNCSNGLQATFTDQMADGTCPGSKIISRTWHLVDYAGNYAPDQVQTITVEDHTAPTFTAPAAATVYTNGTCGYDISPSATGDVTDESDNCSTGIQATYTDATPVAGSCQGARFVIRTWHLVDGCGNAAGDQTQTINILDNTAPTFTRPADKTIYTSANCSYDASVVNTGDVTDEADNCSTGLNATYTDVINAGGCEGQKIISRTWHLVDNCNNAAADQVQTITVSDNTAPTFMRPADFCIYTDANCNYNAAPSITGDVTDEADNCSTGLNATYSDAVANGTCAGSKVITRTWSLVDKCGNAAANQVQTITVKDNTAPTVVTTPVSVTLVNGLATITATNVNNGSYDNCTAGNALTMALSRTSFSCADIGTKTVTLTVTDACNNSANANATITINGYAPACSITSIPSNTVFTGGNPNNIYLGYGPQSATLSASASGGTGFTYSWSPAAKLSATNIANPVFTPTAGGNYTYTVTATNGNGCFATRTITMCVLDIRVPGSNGKVYICHVPNSTNSVPLSISDNAVSSHVPGHPGDRLGSCDQVICATTSTRMSGDIRNEVGDEVKVYPNPNTGVFTVELPYIHDKATITVMDVAGKIILKKTVKDGDGNKQRIDLGDAARGVYMLHVQCDDVVFRGKLNVE